MAVGEGEADPERKAAGESAARGGVPSGLGEAEADAASVLPVGALPALTKCPTATAPAVMVTSRAAVSPANKPRCPVRALRTPRPMNRYMYCFSVTYVNKVTRPPALTALEHRFDNCLMGVGVVERSMWQHDNGTLPGDGALPVLPALRALLPARGLPRGSVVAAGRWSLFCLALAAGASAAGAWCAVVGLPQLGVAAAADTGLNPDRMLLIPEPGPNWPQVVASLLDGCELVLLRPPGRLPAQARRRLEATVRRFGGVLLVAGDWDGAQVRLLVTDQEWTGIGAGHGRLRARRARVVADGRGAAARSRAEWLWLPGPDGSVILADEAGGSRFWPDMENTG